MGCCNHRYREHVEAEECRINKKGSERLPLSLKLIMIIILLIAIVISLL
ncbi:MULTISPECIES: hypothetical protein [Anoxybacillus]|nr:MULTISPECIES: hypothetical protein [Anoxybacillus]MBE2915934.1 hypothetical protein [Anoxybacillus flavithermus]MBE2927702.1 hypothetical protein [Anoxybacillus flavithermus]MBE2929210.1 hypothetical protein [Anoxybacillus flavithermus]MBE2938441.1 hypothetical protein [Anoxybacillus flavithermus]MBE2946301.1 hypothetical protein [Anoxybacillus flavithermus]